MGDVHVPAAGRPEDVLLGPVLIALSGNLLDDHREQQVTQVGIGLGSTGNEAQFATQDKPEKCLVVRRFLEVVVGHDRARGEHRVSAGRGQAALVAEQVFHRDPVIVLFGDGLQVRGVFQDAFRAEDLVFDGKFALLLEEHDARGGNQFRDRCNTQDVTRSHFLFFPLVGPAETFGIVQGVAPHDRQADALELPFLHEIADLPLHSFQVGGVGHRIGQHLVEVDGRAVLTVFAAAAGTADQQGEGSGQAAQDPGTVSHFLKRSSSPMIRSAVCSMPSREESMQKS